jgi:hypothetical protein
MSIIHIEELFSLDPSHDYLAIDDSFFQGKHFLLEAIYLFELNNKSSKFPLFNYSQFVEFEKAIIFKLNKQYYLTSVDSEDGYRDNRGKIYQLLFNENSLLNFLHNKNIQNVIPVELDVVIKPDTYEGCSGILFYLSESGHYNKQFLSLITHSMNTYYPNADIEFDYEFLNMATPYIEKQIFNKTLDSKREKHYNNKKVKI